jgi:hypothetical protein
VCACVRVYRLIITAETDERITILGTCRNQENYAKFDIHSVKSKIRVNEYYNSIFAFTGREYNLKDLSEIRNILVQKMINIINRSVEILYTRT